MDLSLISEDNEGFGELHWVKSQVPDEESDLTFIIRQSTSGNMLLCEGRVGLMQQTPQQDPSEAMFAGTGQHFFIDRFISDFVEGRDIAWVSDVIELERFITEVARTHDNFELLSKFASPKHLRQWVTEAMFLFSAWIEEWFLVNENQALCESAILREDTLYRPLGRVGVREVWLQGSPDMVTPELLVDWKTSGRKWRKGKALGMQQDDLYAGLAEYNHGITLTDGMFLVGARDTRKWEEHRTRMSRASIDAALYRAYGHARDLILGTWSYTPTGPFGMRDWPCRPKFCEAWDTCPARFLGDEYDILSGENRGSW